MPKKIIIVLFVSFLIPCFASALTSLQQQNMLSRLTRLTATEETRVGLAFIDLKSGWEFSVNGKEEFPSASVIKLAVMATAYHLADAGELDLNQKLVFREENKVGGSGVLQWMKPGNAYTIWNLNRLMIVLSDNIATRMLVDHIGMEKINNYLRGIGLTRTTVSDPTMLNEPPSLNVNVTTPLEMAYLIRMIKEGNAFSKSSSSQMLSFMRNSRYRWGIPRGIAYKAKVANKTGNLEGIYNDAGLVYAQKGNYVLTVFTKDFKGKRAEARRLINETSRIVYEEYTGEKILMSNKNTINNKSLPRKYPKTRTANKRKR